LFLKLTVLNSYEQCAVLRDNYGVMPDLDIFSEEFSRQAAAAGDRARRQMLEQGIPVCYLDKEFGVNVIEYPDGRKVEIRFIPGAPGDRNYEVIRELTHPSAA
jgi:hypothetical protein